MPTYPPRRPQAILLTRGGGKRLVLTCLWRTSARLRAERPPVHRPVARRRGAARRARTREVWRLNLAARHTPAFRRWLSIHAPGRKASASAEHSCSGCGHTPRARQPTGDVSSGWLFSRDACWRDCGRAACLDAHMAAALAALRTGRAKISKYSASPWHSARRVGLALGRHCWRVHCCHAERNASACGAYHRYAAASLLHINIISRRVVEHRQW
jgi:hypothetical protein